MVTLLEISNSGVDVDLVMTSEVRVPLRVAMTLKRLLVAIQDLLYGPTAADFSGCFQVSILGSGLD